MKTNIANQTLINSIRGSIKILQNKSGSWTLSPTMEIGLLRFTLTGSLVLICLIFYFLTSESQPNMTSSSVNDPADMYGHVLCTSAQKDEKFSTVATSDSVEGTICFILGEDRENGTSRFYTSAAHFYSQPGISGTYEDIVMHCRSLEEVKNYLNQYPSQTGQPWKKIELVVHSNEWTGLSVPVVAEGERTSVKVLREALQNPHFKGLRSDILNGTTQIELQSCALGHNKQLLQKIGMYFGGKENPCNVTASDYFVHFKTRYFNGQPLETKKQQLDYSYAFYKTGYKPAEILLARQLSKRYPNKDYNWRFAMQHSVSEQDADIFHNAIRIPIRWTVVFQDKTNVPVFETKEAETAWILDQEPLKEILENYELSPELFRWKTKITQYEKMDGTKIPAVKIYGDCTALCILKTVDSASF